MGAFQNPGATGYQDFYLFVSALSFVGLVAAFVVYRKVQGNPAAVQPETKTGVS